MKWKLMHNIYVTMYSSDKTTKKKKLNHTCHQRFFTRVTVTRMFVLSSSFTTASDQIPSEQTTIQSTKRERKKKESTAVDITRPNRPRPARGLFFLFLFTLHTPHLRWHLSFSSLGSPLLLRVPLPNTTGHNPRERTQYGVLSM
jgi:hypothetical protein